MNSQCIEVAGETAGVGNLPCSTALIFMVPTHIKKFQVFLILYLYIKNFAWEDQRKKSALYLSYKHKFSILGSYRTP